MPQEPKVRKSRAKSSPPPPVAATETETGERLSPPLTAATVATTVATTVAATTTLPNGPSFADAPLDLGLFDSDISDTLDTHAFHDGSIFPPDDGNHSDDHNGDDSGEDAGAVSDALHAAESAVPPPIAATGATGKTVPAIGATIGKDEMNLAEFPFAVLARRVAPNQKTIEVIQEGRDAEGRPVRQEWLVTGSDRFGLPTAADDEVYVALMKLLRDNQFKERSVKFTVAQLLRVMQSSTGKRDYERIAASLDRLTGVTLRSKNAFWDHARKRYVTEAFHLLDGYRLATGGTGRDLSEVTFSNFLFGSIQAGYVKNLDVDFYFSLTTPLARRYYRLLDKHRYRGRVYEIELRRLAAKLPLQDKFESQLKRRLDPVFTELRERGFLDSAEYRAGAGGTTIVRVRFADAVLPRTAPATTLPSANGHSSDYSSDYSSDLPNDAPAAVPTILHGDPANGLPNGAETEGVTDSAFPAPVGPQNAPQGPSDALSVGTVTPPVSASGTTGGTVGLPVSLFDAPGDPQQNPADSVQAITAALRAQGVNRADAERLARSFPDECRRQLEYLPFVQEFRSGRGAYLRAAIEQGFAPPSGWLQKDARETRQRRAQAAKAEAAAKVAARGNAVTSTSPSLSSPEGTPSDDAASVAADAAASLASAEMARMRTEEPDAWQALVAAAEATLPPPIRNRPDGPAYRPALESRIQKLIADRLADRRNGEG